MINQTTIKRVKFWFSFPGTPPAQGVRLKPLHVWMPTWLALYFLLVLCLPNSLHISSIIWSFYLGLLYLGILIGACQSFTRWWPLLKPSRAISWWSKGFLVGAVFGGLILGWRCYHDGLTPLILPSYWPVLPLGSLALAIVEEGLFRGWLLMTWAQHYPAFWANLVQSLCFAGAHFIRVNITVEEMLYQGLGLCLIGFFLGCLTWLSQNLWLSIGVHSAWILLAYGWAMMPINVSDPVGGGAFLTAIPLVQLILVCGILWLYLILPFKAKHPEA